MFMASPNHNPKLPILSISYPSRFRTLPSRFRTLNIVPVPLCPAFLSWPGAQEAVRLIVAGENALDKEGEEYLRCLRNRFSLPIEYEQIVT